MKNKIKKILREEIEKIEEDYPSSFDMELFKDLESFKKRVHYAKEQLPKISSGSGRMVFKIDDEKVLKLAKNKKGIAQNEVEVDHYEDPVAGDIFAKIYNHDEDYRWTEMQLARKVKKEDFKRILGVDFNDFSDFIFWNGNKPENEELKEKLWNTEFVNDVISYIMDFGVPSFDLSRKNSYGVVEENGQERIVIVDYGLSAQVYECYYC